MSRTLSKIIFKEPEKSLLRQPGSSGRWWSSLPTWRSWWWRRWRSLHDQYSI